MQKHGEQLMQLAGKSRMLMVRAKDHSRLRPHRCHDGCCQRSAL